MHRFLLTTAFVSCLLGGLASAQDVDVWWIDQVSDERPEWLGLPDGSELSPIRMPVPELSVVTPNATIDPSQGVQRSFAEIDTNASNQVRPIPSYVPPSASSHRLVRYDVPLEDVDAQRAFAELGVEGHLLKVPSGKSKNSIGDRLKSFANPIASRDKNNTIRVVRYEVPADQIAFHSQMIELDGEILEPGMLRLPEVRFFQPKARIFSDLKSDNDDEFDLFADGAILASLDVVELYFPMPLFSERFAEAFGKPSRLSSLGWRVGGTVGLGIATALNNGSTDNNSSPVSTLSAGVRYEFPLGRPSRELLDTGDIRLDQRTRVGIEWGFQGGFSTRESLKDRTDVGMYLGILVDTPWGG